MSQLNSYQKSIRDLKEKNLYRSLVASDVVGDVFVKRGGKKFLSFSSNDYFALSQNAAVKRAAVEAIKKFGVGAGASRYVLGNNSLYEKLEKQIARMKKCDDAIVFSSGYATALGVLPALVGEGDLIVADRLIHASLIDGAKLSGARLMRFAHNDITHAKKILTENRQKFRRCLIITESVFSMDGDVGEVLELSKLANEFDTTLVVDGAHDLGLSDGPRNKCGVTSRGEVRQVCHPALVAGSSHFLQLGTLSKSVGALGGYVAGEKTLIDFLRNFSRSQIYSTALPPAILAASLASLKIIEKKNLGQKVLENAEFFCELMNLPKPQSAIVPIILGDAKKTLLAAENLAKKGLLVSAIRPPTVEQNKSRLRITFSAAHKKSDIKKLANFLLKN